MMIVTFCGHRELAAETEVRQWLEIWLEKLINQGADTFLLGGYGEFDSLAAGVVRQMKKKYPQIRSILVKAYLDSKPDESKYDETIYPGLENVPKKYAIVYRNRYMVDKAQIVLAYVTHDWGGAAKTLEYAQHKNKTLLIYPEKNPQD